MKNHIKTNFNKTVERLSGAHYAQLDQPLKQEKVSKPADFKKAISHFEAGYKERKRKQSKLKLALGYATLVGLTAGVATGVATEMSSAQSQNHDYNPTSWISSSIDSAIENAENVIHPGSFDSIGQQTVIAHEGDNITGLIEENVRGYAKLENEQFMILVDQVMKQNGLDSDRLLQIGESVVLPESVND